jgi:2-dehydro-3-deoxyphosphogluconate aldolase/(4S)-4-hydroxy-2-oxoglutarate aldolase
MATTTLQRLRDGGVVAILTVQDAASITDVVDALVDGGVSSIEVVLRTETAWSAIERLGSRADIVLGAGTVLEASDVARAADLGATFIVSPGIDPSLVDEALGRDVLPMPGVASPTEVQLALRSGLDAMKLFPAEPIGGIGMLAALAGPFAGVDFMPSGGITPGNLESYLRQPNVFAAGCSWLAPPQLVAAAQFDGIRQRAREAAELVGTARA